MLLDQWNDFLACRRCDRADDMAATGAQHLLRAVEIGLQAGVRIIEHRFDDATRSLDAVLDGKHRTVTGIHAHRPIGAGDE